MFKSLIRVAQWRQAASRGVAEASGGGGGGSLNATLSTFHTDDAQKARHLSDGGSACRPDVKGGEGRRLLDAQRRPSDQMELLGGANRWEAAT